MKKIFIALMLALSLILCCGCFEAEVENEDDHFYCDTAIDELETKNEMLEDRIEELESQIENLESTVYEMRDTMINYHY